MLPHEVDYQKIGSRIKTLRLEKRLTQSQLGEQIGCSNNHLSHVETGVNKVSLGLLLRLSYALDSSLDYFLLDTQFAKPEAVIAAEIAPKLAKCTPSTLLAVSRMIDTLLEQQETLQALS